MTNSERFNKPIERAALLATHDPDNALDHAERDLLFMFFLTSYSSLLRLIAFHITRSLICSFSVLALFRGRQYVFGELIQYQAKFQRAVMTLQHSFIKPVLLLGNDYREGLRDHHPQDPSGRTPPHARVHRPPGTSRSRRGALDVLSRSCFYNIPRVVCPLIVHVSILLCRATATPLEQAATLLSVAQWNCFIVQYVNHLLHIRLFPITIQHTKASQRPRSTQHLSEDLQQEQLARVRAGSCTAPNKLQYYQKLFYDVGEVLLRQPDKIGSVCVAHLFAHSAAVPEFFNAEIWIFFVFGDADWRLYVRETLGIVAQNTAQSEAER